MLEAILVCVLILALEALGVVLVIAWLEREPSERAQRHATYLRAQQADRELQLAYRQARHQMNKAAGQHWRNLVD